MLFHIMLANFCLVGFFCMFFFLQDLISAIIKYSIYNLPTAKGT